MVVHFAIDRLSALDLDRAVALHAESFEPLGERGWTRQEFAQLLASPGVAGLLLRADGGDAGFALCRVAADEAELLTIAVRPLHRRRGVGRRLLTAVIDLVREAGAQMLFLDVGADNQAARSLYDAEGFCPVGCRPAYFRRDEGRVADGIVMCLTLSR
jgi:ribosomal-protein-alanine N-acetyltransferase